MRAPPKNEKQRNAAVCTTCALRPNRKPVDSPGPEQRRRQALRMQDPQGLPITPSKSSDHPAESPDFRIPPELGPIPQRNTVSTAPPAKPEIILQQGKLFRPSPQGQRCDAPRCKTTWKGSPTNPCQPFRPCQNLFRQGRFAIFETRWRSHRSFGCNTSANDYSSSRYMCST